MSILSSSPPLRPSGPASDEVGAQAAAWAAAAERRAGEWRAAAAVLLQTAALVEQLAPSVAAFDRDDVWQGAVARAFHEDLERWRHWLAGDSVSVAQELQAAGRRIEDRAGALDAALIAACPSEG